MANNNTETRRDQLVNLLAFAKENGYDGNTDKLSKVLEQWGGNGTTTAAYAENLEFAKAVRDYMETDKKYSNADIRESRVKLPISASGKVQSAKVTAIMNVGIKEGFFKSRPLGHVLYYSLA